jgi:hypothetical protein
MPLAPELTEQLRAVKSTPRPIMGVLGAKQPSHHLPCRFCGSSDALSIYKGDTGWRWKCHSCSRQGDALDALSMASGVSLTELLRGLAPAASTITPVGAPPVPNEQRLRRLLEEASGHAAAKHPSAVAAARKRGLDLDFLTGQYCVGFLPAITFSDWPHWHLKDAWALPISGPDGSPKAIKLHFEKHPRPGMKSMWAPLGTTPAEKPRHGYPTLWPCPEWFPKTERLYIAGGELKALALIQAGIFATSPTSGESFKWTPDQIKRIAGRRIVVCFDDDEAGRKFSERTIQSLGSYTREIRAVTFGAKGTPSV